MKKVVRVSLDFKTVDNAMTFWETCKKHNPESTWKDIGLTVCHIYIPHLDKSTLHYMNEIGDNN